MKEFIIGVLEEQKEVNTYRYNPAFADLTEVQMNAVLIACIELEAKFDKAIAWVKDQ